MSEYHAPSRRALFAGGALAATTAGVSAFSPAHAEQANKTDEFMTPAPEWVENPTKRLDEFRTRLQYFEYNTKARQRTVHNLAKNGLHVNVLDYCVDPTGVVDCTDQLNKLAERLYWIGLAEGQLSYLPVFTRCRTPSFTCSIRWSFSGMECLPELLRRPQMRLPRQRVPLMNVSAFFIRELIKIRYLMRQIIVRCASECVTCGFAQVPRKGIST